MGQCSLPPTLTGNTTTSGHLSEVDLLRLTFQLARCMDAVGCFIRRYQCHNLHQTALQAAIGCPDS